MEVITIESSAFNEILSALEEIKNKVRKLELERINDQWFTGERVLNLLKISKRTLQNYRDSGKIGFSQIGSKIYYRRADIEEFLNRHYNQPF